MADNNLTAASGVEQEAIPASQPALGTGGPQIATEPARSGVKRPGDRIFEILSTASATLITIMVAAIAAFLIWRAVPALAVNEGGLLGFFTYGQRWETSDVEAMKFGIPTLFATTVLISVFALIIAMPVALGIAIFLSNYAPARAVKPLGFLVDMLAAVPSIVYGLWGWQVLGPALSGFYTWLESWAGGFFLFHVYENSPSFATGRNIFTGGIVLAVMILPIIAATAREVFVQTPPGQVESALALGATRWEVIRMTVLPFGMSGYVAGSMLGLGRALGETMALYMVVSPLIDFRFSLFDGGTTFATAIALAAAEFGNEMRAGAYIAAGLMLFLLTFLVNALARSIVKNK
ncbi:phosphate ABC transporter permease subunit PstC [Corynebacterium flavescens]|uniref:Phosphate transport system permease protein n=1 Tax=Corynebacterium flavescens TaxID=28028 RepID=A0A1L7CP20_CORFL|nr:MULTISPECIES: phosphate ABC transporter permease subunit PstC [Corynebacterium]APT87565.1 phosphate ABC transporter permease [Corynebacterium flavescens]KAA8719955.1 phosphate ABC transporter permease subunit PstC [Corynebacterium flavescens]MDN6100432.1 phosphate ABC transporter permease subunit PstC [Corynebacterium flavescens]MDN6236202.1 phosphate ABC transporter permease subunit PstC [Corynebacterium flavescens]MDN6431899.1 phosphate ABC transporter permease subunit PstC [Corynebacteri